MVLALAVGATGLVLAGVAWPQPDTGGAITIDLEWDTTGTDLDEEGRPVIETDLGYVVTLTSASVTTYSVSLVDCPHDHGDDNLFATAGGLVVSAAGASHSSDPDAGEVVGPVIQSIGSSATMGLVDAIEPAYCEAHSAVGAATGVTAGDDDAADLVPTIAMVGTVTSPDGRTTDLAISSTLSWGDSGSLVDPSDESAILDMHGQAATVKVTREIATLFDGLDFSSLSEDEQARQILRNLTGQTRFVVS